MSLLKEFPRAEEIQCDVFDNFFNKIFMAELYMMEAHRALHEFIFVPFVPEKLISVQRLNDLTDLYQFNHLLKTKDKTNAELHKIVLESQAVNDTFDA